MAELVGFVTTEVSPQDIEGLAMVIEHLAKSRNWATSGPFFVDELDHDDLGPGDEPIRTLGAVLDVGAPEGSKPAERHHYEDTLAFVEAFRHFSANMACEVEFELDGNYVGDIREGTIGQTLKQGLLDEWAKRLGGGS